MTQNRNLYSKYLEAPIIIRHEQIGIGMSVQLLPMLMTLKNIVKNDIYLACFKHHIPLLSYYIDDEFLYPYKQKIYDETFECVTDKIFADNDKQLIEYHTGAAMFPPFQSHAVDHYFRIFFPEMHDREIPLEIKNYPKFPVEKIDISKYNLPKNYVVFGPAFTKPSCNMPSQTQYELINYCVKKGYEVVVIGDDYQFDIKGKNPGTRTTIGTQINQNFFTENVINLLTQTSLPEAIAIMAGAKCFIGPEGGLMNMCGLTDTPMIIPFTSMSPKTRMPYRHNELGWGVYPVLTGLECEFCITKAIHVRTGRNVMMECMFDDFKCIDELTFDKFKIQLDKVL